VRLLWLLTMLPAGGILQVTIAKRRNSGHTGQQMAKVKQNKAPVKAPATSNAVSNDTKASLLVAGVVLTVGVWAMLAFQIGTYGVETDFYAAYWGQAEAITHGHIEWDNFRPPFYPMAVALVHLVVPNYYRAGMVLSLLSAALAALLCFRLFREFWGDEFALLALAILLVHPQMLLYMYCPGTDMFFFAICVGAVYALVKQNEWAAGALMGLALVTRYNGLFLLPVGLWYARRRWPLALTWASVVGAFAVLSYRVTGAIFPNQNYLNVAYLIFGESRSTWDEFWYGSAGQYTSLWQVVTLDPFRSLVVFANNVPLHLYGDMMKLATLPVFVLAVLGMVTQWRHRAPRVLWWSGLALFLLLCSVFYNERFALFLLAVYVPLAVHGVNGLSDYLFSLRSARTSS
jgi:hypothetical protein